jgi:outer membrane protein assembly factor BamB
MYKNRFITVTLSVIISMILIACSGVSAGSWPGLSISKDMAFVSNGSFVYAIHSNDGTLIWKYPTTAVNGQSFYATPEETPDGSQLIVGNFNSTLFSLDPATGTEKWSFTGAKGRWIGPALITADTIYAPSSDNNLYALDYQGKLKWTFNAKGANWAQPVTDGQVLFLPSMDHNLYSIQPSDGKQIWVANLGNAIISSPLLDSSGILYMGTLGNEVLAVQAATGKILWRTSISGSVWSSPVMQNNVLYINDLTGQVYALSTANGNILWQHKVNGRIVGSPVLTSNGLVVGDDTGNLTALDLKGTLLWSKAFNGKLYSNLVYQPGMILVTITGSSDYLVVGIDDNGTQKWTFVPPK